MATTVTIPDTKSLAAALNGNKTYVLLFAGALVIVGNHFGLIPPQYVPADLNPNNWISDLYLLAFGATGRSALKKLEGDVGMTPAQADKAGALAAAISPALLPTVDMLIKQWATETAKANAAQSNEQKPAA